MTRKEYRQHAAVERAFASVREASQALINAEYDLREVCNDNDRLYTEAYKATECALALFDILQLHPLRDLGDV